MSPEATAEKAPGKREQARQEKAAAEQKAREAKIESGDLVVTKTHEFEVQSKDTQSSKQIQKIVDAYKRSEEPLVFAEVAKKAGAKYPEDLIACMYSLEAVGYVRRYGARSVKGTDRRPRQAFLWIGDRA
jgi:hypothetical protein